MRSIIALLAIVLILASCGQNKQTKGYDSTLTTHDVVVDEVIQTTSYTYFKVSENDSQYWIAVTKRDGKPGDKFSFGEGMEMKDFKSTELNRVFESVIFIQDLTSGDVIASPKPEITGHSGVKNEEFNSNIKLEKVAGCVSIIDLFYNKSTYAGKTIKVHGQVTKVNNSIMNQNWIHLQDGTRSGNDYELTVTSQQKVEVGQIITIEGTITLDKDFGAGYFYPVLMENGVVVI